MENNLEYDRTEDLIKISALLAVGKHINQESHCPKDSEPVYEEVYQQIFPPQT